jgi:Arc/MetJ-type ribon-helix-helix transcriptional regulator
MTHGVSFHSNVISEKTYSFGNLSEVIRDLLRWAEETIEELRIKLATVYPWRGEMAERS